MTSVGGWKLLTARTLGEWLAADGGEWHVALGKPLLQAPGLRGSALLLLQPEYLRREADVVWWSVADTGGVRAGLSPLPSHIADALPQPGDRLRHLLANSARHDDIAHAVNQHTPLPQWFAPQVLTEEVRAELMRSSYDPYSWMHEVVLKAPPPVSRSAIAGLIVPNVMRAGVRRELPREMRGLLQGYNPALGVESIERPGTASPAGIGETNISDGVWCIGAYESSAATHFPFHAAPILARAHDGDRWTRERYAILRPYRLVAAGPQGPARALEAMSVRQGDYIALEPTPIDARTQVVVVGPSDVICISGLRSLLQGLFRGLIHSQDQRRASYLRRSFVTVSNFLVSRGTGPSHRRRRSLPGAVSARPIGGNGARGAHRREPDARRFESLPNPRSAR